MKFTIALLLFASLHVSAKTYSQDRITLKLEGTELKTALKQIEKKSMYRFLYNDDVISAHRKVSINATNALVTEVLDNILTETSLGYKVLDNNLVVITQKDFMVQETKVSGKVTGADGQGIPAVTVRIKGSGVATTTGADGSYNISAPDGATLVFSSVGYITQETAVSGRTQINIKLEIAAKDINEVVVIGYGTASKRDLTGSITKVAGKVVADKPNTNPVASLQGRVAGLSVVNNGVPGSQPDIRIRGTISMGSVNPLYVVDGIFTDNIDYLNPNDIESIEILKDPSSLAIFGVKGASGVIAISTKRAKSGQVSINLSSNFGAKKLVDKIEMANASEFKTILAREAASTLADNNSTTLTNFLNGELDKWTGNTDWVDAVTRTAYFNNSNLSIAAASDKNKFNMGLGYTLDQGLVKRSEYKRYTVSFNDEYRLSKAIKVGFNFIGSSEKLPYNSSALYDARKALPIIPDGTKQFKLRNPYLSVFDSAMYNLYSTTPVIQNTERNPLLSIENNWNKLISDKLRAVGNAFVEINFTKELSLRTTIYKDFTFGDERTYTPVYYAYNPAATDPAQQAFLYSPLSSVNVKDYNQRSTQQDYILSYKKTFGDHSVNLTAGNTWYKAGYNENTILSKSVTGDQPIPDDKRFWYASNGFATPANPRSSQWEYSTVSFLGRALYNFKNKYYLTASYRRDYASNINEYEKSGQNFWAVGAGWEITRESFMQNQSVFNFLKLKGSIGVLGNFNTGTIGGYYPFYPGVTATQATFGVNTVSVFENNYLPDPTLRWETVHAKEVGIEFNMLGNKLHGEINYYTKNTKDLLAFLKQGGVLGRLTNSGEISNSGFELSASWDQKINKDLSLTVAGNLTTFKNKVIALTQIIPADPQYANRTIPGQPIG
ncbi:MAG: SusC/RagA family TonB-linked outer membrane protein, partial [Bacteroidota bacterium]